jgi:hypothetical protein
MTENSVVLLLNKVNSTNCLALSKRYSRSEAIITTYARSVLKYLDVDSELHICNLIGICSLSFYWRKISPTRPDNIRITLSKSLLSKPYFLLNYCNLFCVEYSLGIAKESDLDQFLKYLFENIGDFVCLTCLRKFLEFTLYKLQTESPLLLQSIYKQYQCFPKSFPSMRHKFFYQDLDDLFSNKLKRINPYLKDIQMIQSASLNSVTKSLGSASSSNKFGAFFNTQFRKVVYSAISQSINITDCFQSIQRLGVSSKQWVEVLLILLYCSVKEKPYNRFYCEVIKLIVNYNPKRSKHLRVSIAKLASLPKLLSGSSRLRLKNLFSDLEILNLDLHTIANKFSPE